MTVIKRKDSKLPKVFIHKVADIRGGVSVATSELNVDFLAEGRVISAPVDGICHAVKYAKVHTAVEASAVRIKVLKGHDFKVGDIVFAAKGGAAYAISAIDASNAAYDEITVKTTLGAIAKDEYIFQAASSGAAVGAFKYAPFAVVGTGKPVFAGTNLDTDAWVIGVTRGNEVPALVAEQLPCIINY